MTAFAEGVKRRLSLSEDSKSNIRLCETVHVRSRIETIASTIKKASSATEPWMFAGAMELERKGVDSTCIILL